MPNEMQMNMDPDSAIRSGELNTNAPGPMEDLTLIGSILKMLDPSSAFRESEAAATMDVGAMQGKLKVLMDMVAQGQKLTPQIRKSLADQAISMMNIPRPDGTTDRFPVEQMDTFPQGTNPDIMKQPAQRMAPAQGMAPVPMPQAPSSEMTVPMPTTQGGAMNMQEMIDAGIIVPKRPMTRPTAPLQSRRPMTRPTQQEAIMAEVNVENMEDNATLFMSKMGFSHTEAGLDMTDDQLVNFLLLCHQTMMGIEDDEMYDDEDMDYGHGDEMMEMPHGKDIKVKVMKLDGGNVQEMMNKLLGG